MASETKATDLFVRVLIGKRSGDIAKFVKYENAWVIVETEIGETPFPVGWVSFVEEKVVDDYCPYFDKQIHCGWMPLPE